MTSVLDAIETPELQAFISFLRAHAAVTRDLDRELVAEHGLTINDYEVLIRLARAPDQMLRRVDLAQQVLLTPSGITRLLAGLQRQGFVEKAACDTDARVVYAKLTESGREKLECASESHFASIRAVFGSCFDEHELEALRTLCTRLHPSIE